MFLITDQSYVREVNFAYLLADDEFQKLCFEFGLELDEVVSERRHINQM